LKRIPMWQRVYDLLNAKYGRSTWVMRWNIFLLLREWYFLERHKLSSVKKQ
jgi:hypothetical protein